MLKRILLIDGNPVERSLTVQALIQNLPGVQIAEIINGDQLAQAMSNDKPRSGYATHNFDLAITDYQLPWTTGLDVLRTLKTQIADCPVIMFTSSGSEEIAVAAMKAGLDDYVIKSPGNLAQLVQAVYSVWQNTQTRYPVEQALNRSERRLSTLISNLPGYVYRVANDRNYTPEFLSEGVFSITGYRPEEYLIERTISCAKEIHPDDRDRVWKMVQQALALQQPYEFEFRIITKSGVEKWVWERGRGIFSDSGELLCLEGFVTDITARKVAETALQESQQLYQTLVEHSPDIIERFDTQLRHLYTSPALTQITGIASQVFLGKTCRELGLPEAMVNSWEAAAQLLLTTGEKQIVEFETPTLNGVRSFEMVIAPELTRDNVIESILCISRDVTDRQRTEAALQQLNQELEQRVQERTAQLKMALSAAKMGTWELNTETNTVHWSPEEYELFGFKTDAQGRVLDQNGEEISPYPTFELFLSCIHPDDRDYVVQKTRQALKQGSSFEVEYRILRDGSIHWVYARGAYVLNEQRQTCRLTGIAMNITNRKQAEAVLQQQARLEQVLRLVTQEIRQSLDLDAILTTAVTEVRQTLQADRVAVYRFDADWSGSFIVESVGSGWVKLVTPNIPQVWEDTYLQATQGGRYKNHETFAVADIYTVGHSDCYLAVLEQFQVRAYGIAPLFYGDHLWGLLAVYQNAAPRHWQSWEIDLLQQIANQLAIAIQQSELYRQLQTELQERRQIEQQIRASLKEKEVLLREVYHRVKNNMQMVSSLLSLQASSIDDPTVLKLLSDSQRRVKTMALVHERLYRSQNLARINFATYVENLVNDLVRSYTANNSFIRVFLEVDALELDLDTAVPCGLIINELVSNALKYAFPNQEGEIKLQFSIPLPN